jgi:hypothetical protein
VYATSRPSGEIATSPSATCRRRSAGAITP